MVNCPSFDRCNAPLCPLDAQSLEHGIWYPDEAICRREHRDERWLAMQKAVAKHADGERGARYFTVAMLSAMWQARRGTVGIDPNSPDAAGNERTWIASRRQPSEESRHKGTDAMNTRPKKPRGSACGNSDAQQVSEVKEDVASPGSRASREKNDNGTV